MESEKSYPQAPGTRALVIINPTSGHESAPDFEAAILETLSRHFDEVEIKSTAKAGDASEFATQACHDKFDAIFAVGGDGTVNEVLAGMAPNEHKPKLGIFPAGTFNAMARLLRIPLDLDTAIRNFDPEHFLPIDIGQVNDHYFAYILSIGDIPEAIHTVSIEDKSKSGVLAYIKTIAGRLTNLGKFEFSIEADGEEISSQASHLLLLLTDYLGPMRIISDGATESDGRMNLLLMKGKRLSDLLALIPDFLAGKIEENEGIDHRRVEEVHIHSRNDLHCDIDGEEGPSLPLKIKVLPRHIVAYYGSDDLEDDVHVFPEEDT